MAKSKNLMMNAAWLVISLMTTVYCAGLSKYFWSKSTNNTPSTVKFGPKRERTPNFERKIFAQPYCEVFNFNAHLFTPHQISDKSSPENSQRLIVEVR